MDKTINKESKMKNEYYDLGTKPSDGKRLDGPTDSKPYYPSLNIDTDKYPPLKEMKLGGEGKAEIKFRIGKDGRGIEVIGMKPCDESKKEETKEAK